MTAKLTTYWRVRSVLDGSIAPWEKLEKPPSDNTGLYGELKVENDDQIVLLYFADEAAYESLTRAGRDAAAIVQVWMMAHKRAQATARPPQTDQSISNGRL